MSSKFLISALLIIATGYSSCTKEKEGNFPPSTSPPPSPLSGQEFTFENLVWEHFNTGTPSSDEIYLVTPGSNDLFVNAGGITNGYYANAEVYVKFDTTANWTIVKPHLLYEPSMVPQYYYTIYPPHLSLNVWPLNYLLIGRKASIKIKFY